jgi:hypothetical protein
MSLSRFGAWACAALIATGALLARADDPQKKESQPSPESFAPKPLPQHKALAREEGVWDATLKFWMPGSEQATTSTGVETNKMMGGIWLVSSYKGEFSGAPFEGHGQTGFDPKKGKYIGTWVDTMGTTITMMEGTYDEPTKTLTMFSDEVDPSTDKPIKAKYVTQSKDDDTRVFTLSMKPSDAKDFMRMMEITYKRRK